MSAVIWLLYGPQDLDYGTEELLGVFSSPELAGEWLYANDEDAAQWKGRECRLARAPYPQPFGDHVMWFTPEIKAIRAQMDGDLSPKRAAAGRVHKGG